MASLAKEMTAESGLKVSTTPNSTRPISSAGGQNGTSSIDSTQSLQPENLNTSSTSHNNSNNTISAAADSSDNQRDTPQPQQSSHASSNVNDATQIVSSAHQHHHHHPYPANPHLYTISQPAATTAANAHLNQVYSQHIYSQANLDTQQQHHQTFIPHSSYNTYMNSYEQFYQQQQQQHQQNAASSSSNLNSQQADFVNVIPNNALFPASDNKNQQSRLQLSAYLPKPPTPIMPSAKFLPIFHNSIDNNMPTPPPSASVASSSQMSPRIVSSTSPTSSNQMQISGSVSSIGSLSAGNPSSPNPTGTPQCKKCGIMCANETELQEHITNVHGASPYGSSGYASSPYIKDEQRTPPSQSQQQQQPAIQQSLNHTGNPGEILDLDSQKMLYPPVAGSMAAIIQQQPLANNNNDPLHGLHNMQQRAGINNWDQQSQESVTAYMQTTEAKNLSNNSSYYQSPRQSPYNVNNSLNAAQQPVIKTEFVENPPQYLSDQQQQQEQMITPALATSPAEFPSTTTGATLDAAINVGQNLAGDQQCRSGNFEPPSSSSAAVTAGSLRGKAVNWKSNEPRREKTYKCTACAKWFTSSGHLKRHYNTTLHKNAVKVSGQPDPATLPISAHHFPNRDPNLKTSRRGGATAKAARRQQQPNPVQPPEPPNSPQDYGDPQTSAGDRMPLAHYAGNVSPNSLYQQQQYQQQPQYMPQIQQTVANVAVQHNASMVNHHLQQQHQNQHQQQQAVINGHPNALAGPSVSPIQQQMPMPSSAMRGLLNTTNPLTQSLRTHHITENEQLEAATIKQQTQANVEAEIAYNNMKVQVKEEPNIYCLQKNEMESVQEMELDQQESLIVLQAQHLPEGVLQEEVEVKEDHHNIRLLQTVSQIQLPQQHHQEDMEYLSSIPTAHSPLIISPEHYQQQMSPQIPQDIYTLTQIQQSPLLANTTEHQRFINMQPLAINNMLQLQQPLITMEQQLLPPATTIPTTNIVNMQPPNHQLMLPLHTELPASTQLEVDITSTNIPSHTPTTIINNINTHSFHQTHQQDSVPQLQDTMLTYPHIITGNVNINGYENVLGYVCTTDETLATYQPSNLPSPSNHSIFPTPPYDSFPSSPQVVSESSDSEYQKSLNEVDFTQDFKEEFITSHNENTSPTPLIGRNTSNQRRIFSTVSSQEYLSTTTSPQSSTTTKRERKRIKNTKTSCTPESESRPLTENRVQCKQCDKDFTNNTYLTQHMNKCHSGEYRYKCTTCGKGYLEEEKLKSHLARHSAIDKPYKCLECDRQYCHKYDLSRHYISKHTQQKLNVCTICSKNFSRKDHLRNHITTHTRPRTLRTKTPKI